MKEIVLFKNRNNNQLFGIVHKPSEIHNSRRKGIILSNTGTHYRVAWHRLNLKLANFLSQYGYFVLRFDPHGIGDSEGELNKTQDIIYHYNAIQQGLFVDDTIAAIDFFKSIYNIKSLCLAGICGGALSSILTAGIDSRVDKVIFIAGPVTISSEMEFKTLHPVYAKELFKIYIQKIVNPKFWVRFITGKSDYSLIKKIIFSILREKDFKKSIQKSDEGVKGDFFNYKFLEAFLNIVKRGGKILFIMAEVDPATWQFENFFKDKYLFPGNPYEKQCEYHVINGANHTFSTEVSQTQLFNITLEWLKKNECH